jgi:hypothetical protein
MLYILKISLKSNRCVKLIAAMNVSLEITFRRLYEISV